MSDGTHISWSDATWNIVTGCTKISSGCDRCYIDRTPPFRMEHRAFDAPGVGGTTGVKLHSERLSVPLRWRKPRRIFVCSLADLFHDDVPARFLVEAFSMMARCPQHVFQVLTKRPARMRALLSSPTFVDDIRTRAGKAVVRPIDTMPWPLPNVWVGVSVETQQWASVRIPILADTPAAVRWISAEPLLGPIELWSHLWRDACPSGCGCRTPDAADARECACDGPCCTDEWNPRPALDWVVTGAESGPGARPAHPDWFRDLRDECQAAGVAYHHKQNGEWISPDQIDTAGWDDVAADENGLTVWPDGRTSATRYGDQADGSVRVWRVGKRRAGRLLDGRTHDEYPDVARYVPGGETP